MKTPISNTLEQRQYTLLPFSRRSGPRVGDRNRVYVVNSKLIS